jgi:hypothetical protein
MLLIDHQSGLFQTIQDMPFTEVRTNATTLAGARSTPPDPQKTMPSAIAGPLATEPHDANDHKISPVVASSAHM